MIILKEHEHVRGWQDFEEAGESFCSDGGLTGAVHVAFVCIAPNPPVSGSKNGSTFAWARMAWSDALA